jgi:N-acetylglucosamine kinase-like BadF-type ATPase
MAPPDLMASPSPLLPRDAGAWDGFRLLGIDIGGTASRARLWARGQLAAESQAASASLPAAGREAASAALSALLDDVLAEQAEPLDAIGVGSAGLSVPGAREFLHGRLAPLTRSGAVVIVSDAMLALPAAGLGAGVAVICGTGSVAVGTSGGRTVQVGGWGYLLGDAGSGYWIVREAMRVLLSRRDHGQPPGELGQSLFVATGTDDLAMLHRRYYEQPHLPAAWARYAGLVLDSGDPAAAEISARAARAVAELAGSAAAELESTGERAASCERGQPGHLPVVLAGGLFRNQAFRHGARNAVAQALPGTNVRVLDDEPVAGAVQLAGLAAERQARQT